MSLRAELVRLGLRWFVKRKIGPATTLEALRRQDAFLARLVPPPPKGTQTTHIGLDGVKAVAVVTPASLGGRLVLYLHGGGHVSGSLALYGDFTWRIAAATRAHTVILDHRLAPEHPFPAALDDAVTAYRALLTDGADPIAALLRDFRHGGPKAIERVRRTQPAAYLKILALLVPREHKVEHSNPLKGLTDEQLEAMIEYIETSLVAQAGAPAKMIEGTIPISVQVERGPLLDSPKPKNKVMLEADTAVSPRERIPRKIRLPPGS